MLKINYTCCVLSRQKTNKQKYKQSLKVRERQTKELRKISFVRARPHPRPPASTPAISPCWMSTIRGPMGRSDSRTTWNDTNNNNHVFHFENDALWKGIKP